MSEDDLWLVEADGGIARRLTANPGVQSFPLFSPDGTLIAYTSRDEGQPEANVVGVGGGTPRRLSWFGSMTSVAGWTRDGSAVIVATDAGQPFPSLMELVAVPLDGSPTTPLGFGPARAVSFQPGGPGVVIGRNSADPARWKRYRGGTAGTIWIDRKGDGEFVEMIELAGNLARPMWIDGRIYFLSDHEGHGNLYSCTPTGRNLARHTSHEDYYARYPAADGRSIVYHCGADVWRFDVAAGRTDKVDVRVPSSRPQRARKFEPASKRLETIDLHPKGEQVAITARGTAASMPLWEGVAHLHHGGSHRRSRLTSWMPDGRRLVAVSDDSGEERLVVFAADGTGEHRTLSADVGRPYWIEPAPAGTDRVAVLNERQEVLVVNVTSGRAKRVHRSPDNRPAGLAWSPDGRWLAFGADTSVSTSAIFVTDTTTGRVQQVTSGEFRDGYPSFDPAGRYLYFLSTRTFDPVSDLVFHDYGFPLASRPYVIPLAAETPSPFAAEHREARAPGAPPNAKQNGGPNGEKANGKDAEAPEPVEIEFDGIVDRTVAVPVPAGRFTRVAGATGRILFSSLPVEGSLGDSWRTREPRPRARLQAYDFAKAKVDAVADKISSFTVSMDGKVLAIRVGKKLRVVSAGFKEEGPPNDEIGRETGWVDLNRMRVEVDPGAEWTQMLREAWRLQRDQFWTDDMSGVEWTDVYRRYAPLVDRVGSRSEFSDLMWEMQGELGTSHAYELGGDYRPAPAYHQGFLGADLEFDRRSGSWRVVRIPRGDSWDPAASSPLSAPAVDVRAGDRLLAIEGAPLDEVTPPGRLLTDRAGRPVSLTVKRGRRRERSTVVKTMRSEQRLRYRDWVNGNRATVHEATDGRVGYLHVPDMGAAGYAEFHRHLSSEIDRPGVIIDVRFNAGGNVSQLLIQKLLRKRIGYDVTRYGESLLPYPIDSPRGPMVALTNEWAGSDGDIFSHAFKLYGLGPLIGTRTWGGVVGIWPRHSLVDGTITTQPEYSYWFEDVGWGVENYGTDPDIEVVITPQDYGAGRDPQLERGIAEVERIIEARGVDLPELHERPSKKPPSLPPIEP